MNANQFHDQLYDLGIRLVRDGDVLSADVQPGVDIAPHLDLIREHAPVLLRAADLREQIITAATVDPAEFDRVTYDAMWAEWNALDTVQEDAA